MQICNLRNIAREKMLKLSKYATQNAKAYGAYIEVSEVTPGRYDVWVYQEKTRVDRLGNRYVERN